MDSLGGQKGEVAGQKGRWLGRWGEVAGVVASERVRWSHLRVAVCSLGSKPTGQQLHWGEGGREDTQSSLDRTLGCGEIVKRSQLKLRI